MTPAALRTRSPRRPTGARALLAQLANDLRYHYRTLPMPLMPLGLGQCRQRRHRVTMRATYWWRYADDFIWIQLRPGGIDHLPRCRNEADIERLLVRGVR